MTTPADIAPLEGWISSAEAAARLSVDPLRIHVMVFGTGEIPAAAVRVIELGRTKRIFLVDPTAIETVRVQRELATYGLSPTDYHIGHRRTTVTQRRVIRAWAQKHGYVLTPKGRIPRDVQAAYWAEKDPPPPAPELTHLRTPSGRRVYQRV